MLVKWYGHACFRLEGGGVAIVTDPYTPELAGLLPVSEPADVVVMSSALDEAHSNAAMIASIKEFLAHRAADPVVRHPGSTMEIDAHTLGEGLTVHVLQPALDPLVLGGAA